MKELLALLKQNARLSNAELAAMLGKTEQEVAAEIADLEHAGVIRGYSVILDEDHIIFSHFLKFNWCHAKEKRIIANFEEVESVTLMSGGYDLGITISGTGLRDIAGFVAQRLATLDGVLSTRTHFVLKRYKEKGIFILEEPDDERGVYL